MGGYATRTMTGSKRLRRAFGPLRYIESDPAVGFGDGMDNVLCGLSAGRLLVPASYYSATLFGTQAAAEAAFLANFTGVNMGNPAAGTQKKVAVAQAGCLELPCDPDTFEVDDYLTFVWDATNGWIDPKKFDKTANTAIAIARVVSKKPEYPLTENVTLIEGYFRTNWLNGLPTS